MKCDISYQLELGFLLYLLHAFSTGISACVWAQQNVVFHYNFALLEAIIVPKV